MKLTVEIIKNLTDSHLYEIISKRAYNLQREDHGLNDDLTSLSLKAFLAIQFLEAEISNGGFHQFFVNEGFYTHADYALEGLMEISAMEFHSLLKKAIEIYETYDKEIDGIEVPELDALDERFYELLEKGTEELSALNVLQVKYIRSNYILFVD